MGLNPISQINHIQTNNYLQSSPPQIVCPPQSMSDNINDVRPTEHFEGPEEQITHFQARTVKERRQTTEFDRQRIRTALDLGHSVGHISEKMGFSRRQIYYVKNNGTTPWYNERSRNPKIPDQKARQIVSWLLSDPANRHTKYCDTPLVAPQLELQNYGKAAIHTAFSAHGYGRRTSKKKVFSNSFAHKKMRLEFARWGRTWSRERLYQQVFSDEVWTHGGANGRNFVTALVEGDKQDILHDRYRPECLT